MTIPTLVPAILCGGFGERLWPLSRRATPKPFLKLTSERLLLVETLLRIPDELPGVDVAAPLVIAAEAHTALVRGALMVSDDMDGTVIGEPVGRNTAPAAALACHFALAQEGEDALVLLLPADHAIADVAAMNGAIAAAIPLAQAGHLVTFGIRPSHPETGYGYILTGEPLLSCFKVRSFVEKPDQAGAEDMIAQGGFWNSGMFLFSARRFLDELMRLRPAMAEACTRAWQGRTETGKRTLAPNAAAWRDIVSESIDYAVMQKAGQVALVPVDPGWSDIGGFAALHELAPKDELGNALIGAAIVQNSTGNLVFARGKKTVALLGCEDLVVVDTPDVVFVVPREKLQSIRDFTQVLAATGRTDLL